MRVIEPKDALRRLALVTLVIGGIRATDIWHVHPGESYGPDTYCRWNRTGLPPTQQKACLTWDQHSGIRQPKWETLEADNGAKFGVDLNSIVHLNNGNAEVVVAEDAGVGVGPGNETRLIFDCRGHYQDVRDWAVLPVPPKAVIADIQRLACAHK